MEEFQGQGERPAREWLMGTTSGKHCVERPKKGIPGEVKNLILNKWGGQGDEYALSYIRVKGTHEMGTGGI